MEKLVSCSYFDTSRYTSNGCKHSICPLCNRELITRYWRCNIVEHLYTPVHQHSEHTKDVRIKKRQALPLDVASNLCSLMKTGVKPSRAAIEVRSVPKKAIQSFYNHRRERFSNNPTVNDLTTLLAEPLIHESYIASQIDSDKCFICFTNKDMLSIVEKIVSINSEFILSADATYKTNKRRYPLLTIGILDKRQSCHLLALALVSQQTEDIWHLFFSTVASKYRELFNMNLLPMYMISDGEQGLKNALTRVFPQAELLDCYFHVVEDIRSHVLATPSKGGYGSGADGKSKWVELLEDVRQLHSCRTEEEYKKEITEVKQRWVEKNDSVLNGIVSRIERYLVGDRSKWQVFRRPPGFPSTNNGLESLHRSIKYSHFPRSLGLLECIRKLAEVVKYYGFEASHAEIPIEYKIDTTDKKNAKTINLDLFIPIAGLEGSYKYKKGPEFEEYIVTRDSCSCWRWRDRAVCKHVLALVEKLAPHPPKNRGLGRPKKKKAKERD